MIHLELALSRNPDQTQIPMDLVHRQQSSGAAFSLACQASGLEDKEIYMAVGIDAGTFSRMKKGEATLQADKEADFCRAVGNLIYPEWRASRLGCTLTLLKTEAERRADESEKRAQAAEAQVEMLKSLLVGRAA
ncbi:MAG: transcriptional regulator [Rhodocyclaceae bacterium]|nr:transcriptional regulator [Rhodocyclaceae bacterium]